MYRVLTFSALLAVLATATFVLNLAISPDVQNDVPGEQVIYRGRVVEASGVGLAQAVVSIKGTGYSTVTELDGAFEISVPSGMTDVTLCAWHESCVIGSTNPRVSTTIQLEYLPKKDFDQYRWVSPHPDSNYSGRCGNCHEEIYEQWTQSSHSRAARNQQFLDMYAPLGGSETDNWSLEREHPSGMGVCAACHAPTVEQATDAQDDLRLAFGVDAEGVHCDFCHKIRDTNLTAKSLGRTHGRYAYELLRPEKGQLFFGPLVDVDRDEDSFSPLFKKSLYCAGCHQGTVLGVTVYDTYNEWKNSLAAKKELHCQTCHMKSDGKLTNFAKGHGGVERPAEQISNHGFATNSIIEMMRNAIKLRLVRSQELRYRVSIETTTYVGHQIPTGYVDRHLMLTVDAFDASGNELKPTNHGALPGWSHSDSKVRYGHLFARVLEDEDGNRPAPFWRVIVKSTDTRLDPDTNFGKTWHYSSSPARVVATLFYRKFWPRVAQAKRWSRNEWETEIVSVEIKE